MKCRSVLYGYKCVGGNVEFNNDEKIVVSNIFRRYSTGESLLKIKQSQVSEWLKGKAKPGYDLLKKIAVAYDVSADYLLGLKDYCGK